MLLLHRHGWVHRDLGSFGQTIDLASPGLAQRARHAPIMGHLMPLLRLAQNHVGVQVELLLPVRTFLRLGDDLLSQLLHFVWRSCLGTELDTLHLGYIRIGRQHLVLRDQCLLLLTLNRVLRLCLLHD